MKKKEKNRKPLHEYIIPIAFYHFIVILVVYALWGLLIDPTGATYIWFIPNLMISITLVMIISISRLLDGRYETLFRKYPRYYLIGGYDGKNNSEKLSSSRQEDQRDFTKEGI